MRPSGLPSQLWVAKKQAARRLALIAVGLCLMLLAAGCSGAKSSAVIGQSEAAPAPESTTSHIEPTAEPVAAPTSVPEPTATPVPPTPEPADDLLLPTGDDDSQLLQDALNTVVGGGTVRLGAGVFDLDQALIVRLDVEVVGAGQGKTVLTRSDAGGIFDVNGVDFGLHDVTISSTFVTEAEERTPLLDIANSTVNIRQVTVEQAPGTGAWMDSVIGQVAESSFNDSGWIGLWVAGESLLEVVNSEARNNGDGFVFDEDAVADVSGNRAMDNEGVGYWWDGNAAGTAQDNEAHGNLWGFYSTQSSAPVLVANLAEDNSEAGFGFGNSSAATANDNSANNNTHGFYIDGDASPTLSGNRAVKNSDAGFAYYGNSGGVLANATSTGNGVEFFFDEQAAPEVINGETPGSALGTSSAATGSGASTCPPEFSANAARCVRVLGSPQLACAQGVLQGSGCAVDTPAFSEQSCTEPYLLFLAEAGDPTLRGLTGTCAYFDNGGVCPAGDVYNPQTPSGELFSHPCKQVPLVVFGCDSGTLVGDVCRTTTAATTRCTAGTLAGSECVEYAEPTG